MFEVLLWPQWLLASSHSKNAIDYQFVECETKLLEVSWTWVWSRWKRCLFPGQGGLFLDQCRLARRRLGTCLALHTMPHLQRSLCKTMTSHQTLIARPDNRRQGKTWVRSSENARERWRRWWRWLSSFFDLCFLNFFLLVFLILHWWQGLMIYDKQDHGPGGERWRRLEARQVCLFCVDLTPSRWLSPYYIDCKVR